MVELERVLEGKLGFRDERQDDVRSFLDRVSPERPRAPEELERVPGDPAHDPVLACTPPRRPMCS